MDFIWNKIQFTITDLGGGKLGEKIPMHAHAKGCYELHFVTEGKGTLIADGNKIEISGTELLARAFCHEYDHLNGELFTDKIIEEK